MSVDASRTAGVGCRKGQTEDGQAVSICKTGFGSHPRGQWLRQTPQSVDLSLSILMSPFATSSSFPFSVS